MSYGIPNRAPRFELSRNNGRIVGSGMGPLGEHRFAAVTGHEQEAHPVLGCTEVGGVQDGLGRTVSGFM